MILHVLHGEDLKRARLESHQLKIAFQFKLMYDARMEHTTEIKREFSELSNRVIGCAVEVHRVLGPGLLESVYEHALAFVLSDRGIEVQTQVPFPVVFRKTNLDLGFRADLVLDRKVIVEVKSIEAVLPVHKKQLLTYLKITGLRLGLLFNFNEELLKRGITRIVHKL